jgi:hypothetical protein
MKRTTVLTMLALSLLLGFSPLSADPVIRRGIDVFSTAGDGKTFFDFSYNPIPADFFCRGSKAFTGRVAFKGLPLATAPAGGLWSTDTVVERLDDAVFNDKSVAVTRVQFRALSLVSIAPIKTSCGAFHVYVSLDGKQRVTTMSIFRTQDDGGTFVGPLAVDVRMTFIPVKPPRIKGTRNLEIKDSVTFPGNTMPWRLTAGAVAQKVASVTVDTDGDLVPDALLPGSSSFSPGESPLRLTTMGYCSCCPGEYCHANGGQQHCFEATQCPGMQSCC